jgi:hypothetical protein
MSNLSRRSLVAGAATIPAAVALPIAVQAATEPDPAFAAVERCATLEKAFTARCTYEDDLAEAGQELPPAPGDHRTREMVEIVDASIAARENLAATSSTTLAGLAAVLDFVVAKSERLSGENASCDH